MWQELFKTAAVGGLSLVSFWVANFYGKKQKVEPPKSVPLPSSLPNIPTSTVSAATNAVIGQHSMVGRSGFAR